jgi:hypothetical protein
MVLHHPDPRLMQNMDFAASYPTVLTPRQDRIEAALLRTLRANGTRSELRAIVYELVDLFRIQGIPYQRALDTVKAVALRAGAAMLAEGAAAGDSLSDRMVLIANWCAVRYGRVSD